MWDEGFFISMLYQVNELSLDTSSAIPENKSQTLIIDEGRKCFI